MRSLAQITCCIAVFVAWLVLSACSGWPALRAETSQPPTPLSEAAPEPLVLLPMGSETTTPEPPFPSATPVSTAVASTTATRADEQELGATLVIAVGRAGDGLALWASEPLSPERQIQLAMIPGTIRAWSLNLSPQGSQVALVVTESNTHFDVGELLIADLRTGAVRHLAANIALWRYMNYPVWSPDGRFLAVLRQSHSPDEQQVVVVDVQSGRETMLVSAPRRGEGDDTALQLYPLDWSPDSAALYVQQGNVGAVELLRIDLGTGRVDPQGRITKEGLPRCYFSSPDGTHLLCMNAPADLRTYALTLLPLSEQAVPLALLTVDGGVFSDPHWSPDGRWLALGAPTVASPQGAPLVVEVQSGRVAPVPLDRAVTGDQFWYPVAWSPIGNWLIIATSQSEMRYRLANTERPVDLVLTLPEATTLVGWVERSVILE